MFNATLILIELSFLLTVKANVGSGLSFLGYPRWFGFLLDNQVTLFLFCLDHRGCGKGKWYKFNDTVVEEFDLTDETLEYECFGGEYRPKVYDQCKQYYRLIDSSFMFHTDSQ